jgi:hypothetical protein
VQYTIPFFLLQSECGGILQYCHHLRRRRRREACVSEWTFVAYGGAVQYCLYYSACTTSAKVGLTSAKVGLSSGVRDQQRVIRSASLAGQSGGTVGRASSYTMAWMIFRACRFTKGICGAG